MQGNHVQLRLQLSRQRGPVAQPHPAHIAEAPLFNNRELLPFLFAAAEHRFELFGIIAQALGNIAHLLQRQVHKTIPLAIVGPARHVIRSAPDSKQPLRGFNLRRPGENGRQQPIKLGNVHDGAFYRVFRQDIVQPFNFAFVQGSSFHKQAHRRKKWRLQ